MTREPVESSLIRSVGYDAPSSILEVELGDGAVYEYFDVPLSAFMELMEAESKGSYYNDFIKDLYASRRLDARPAGETTAPPPGAPAEDRPRATPPTAASARRRGAAALDREIATYRARRREFLRGHEGQFVLIRGEEVVGFWTTREEALEVGYRRFGLDPFLVHQVVVQEPVIDGSRGPWP